MSNCYCHPGQAAIAAFTAEEAPYIVTCGWAYIVTSDYHVNRTKEIFSFIYGPAYVIDVRSVPSSVAKHIWDTELQSLQAFRATFQGVPVGDDRAILKRLERHPFYNGSVYPQI